MLLQLHGLNTRVISLEGCPSNISRRLLAELFPWIVERNELTNPPETCLTIRCIVGLPEYINASENGDILEIRQSDDTAFFHAIRLAIRQGLVYALEGEGWVQIHAGAVALPDGSLVLFVGEIGAGKTSSALGVCRNIKGVAFVSNDRILVHKRSNWAIGWPTAIGIGEEALLRLNINASGYEHDGKIWYWPSQLRAQGFSMIPAGIIRMLVMPHFTCYQEDRTDITKIAGNTLLRNNIRYDALQEDNWWNIKRPDTKSYGKWLISSKWVSDLPAIKIRTSGLCQAYLGILSKEIGI